MFFNNRKSKEKEEQLLRRFLNCLEEIDIYLDKYDENIGLAFNKYYPISACNNLSYFLAERHSELVDELEEE